jgi:methyl-accepting chemotaxis protein WspA
VGFTPVQKLSITSGAAMALLGAVGVVSYVNTMQMVGAQEAAAHTNGVIASLDRIRVHTSAAENATRGFVATGRETMLAALDEAQSEVEFAIDSLRTATEDHPAQRRLLDSAGVAIGGHFRDMRQMVAVRRNVSRDSATQLLGRTLTARPVATQLLTEMREEEVRVLGEKSRLMAESGESTRTFIIAGSIFSFVLALVALQPLRPSVEKRLTASLSAIRDEDLKE